MKYVGVDLHKKTISLCVVMQKAGQRVVVKRETLRCDEPRRIESWFRRLGAFQMTVEATSSYEWFVQLVEPLANRIVLAHPKKLRVIAESTTSIVTGPTHGIDSRTWRASRSPAGAFLANLRSSTWISPSCPRK